MISAKKLATIVKPKANSHFLFPKAKLALIISVADNSGLKANTIEKNEIGTATYIKGKPHNINANIEIPTDAKDSFKILGKYCFLKKWK